MKVKNKIFMKKKLFVKVTKFHGINAKFCRIMEEFVVKICVLGLSVQQLLMEMCGLGRGGWLNIFIWMRGGVFVIFFLWVGGGYLSYFYLK